MATKLTKIDDDREARRLVAAIQRRFRVRASVERGGKEAGADFQIVTDDDGVGGAQLQRIRRYADGWKDSLAEVR